MQYLIAAAKLNLFINIKSMACCISTQHKTIAKMNAKIVEFVHKSIPHLYCIENGD